MVFRLPRDEIDCISLMDASGANRFCSRQAWGSELHTRLNLRTQTIALIIGQAKIKSRLIADLDPDEWDLPPKPKWMRWPRITAALIASTLMKRYWVVASRAHCQILLEIIVFEINRTFELGKGFQFITEAVYWGGAAKIAAAFREERRGSFLSINRYFFSFCSLLCITGRRSSNFASEMMAQA